MKTVIECKRAIMHNVVEDRTVAILAECYNPNLSDRDILCVVYSPRTMEWVDLYPQEELWIKNSNIRIEVICEYKEVEQWFDKIKKWFTK